MNKKLICLSINIVLIKPLVVVAFVDVLCNVWMNYINLCTSFSFINFITSIHWFHFISDSSFLSLLTYLISFPQCTPSSPPSLHLAINQPIKTLGQCDAQRWPVRREVNGAGTTTFQTPGNYFQSSRGLDQ